MYIALILIGYIISSNAFHYNQYNIKCCILNNRMKLSMNKSRMPTFSPEEEEELNRILSGEDFSQNVPKKRKDPEPSKDYDNISYSNDNKILVSKTIIANKPGNVNMNQQVSRQPIAKPNTDWRTRTTDTNINPYQANNNSKKPVKINVSNDAFSFLDLDYDDFEQAMNEEDNGGMNPMGGGSKHTSIPIEHYGLKSCDKVNMNIWASLLDSEGKTCSIERINKDNQDLLILYADPRRMTEEFKLILNQFEKLPKNVIKTSTVVVNCDDINDHRKYYKKNSITNTLLLSDPTRKLMDNMKCKGNKRLSSALVVIDIINQIIVKVWYEGDWDPITTKDMLVEEITLYRKNPRQFVQSQIGLR